MKKIIIREDKEHLLYEEAMLEEMFGGWGDKVKSIKDYLDKNFARAAATMFGEDGKPQVKQVVAWLDDYKQVVKTLTEVQLFYIIQDQFKKIISDKKERDKFLIQVLKDWYNNKITKNYSLSVY
jgi:uncharacterized protein (DUF111 family)